MRTVTLSREARILLGRRARGEHIEVTPENIKVYRELVQAGVMYPLSAYLRGPETAFRFTKEGWDRREELQPRTLAIETLRGGPKNPSGVIADGKIRLRHSLNHLIMGHTFAR